MLDLRPKEIKKTPEVRLHEHGDPRSNIQFQEELRQSHKLKKLNAKQKSQIKSLTKKYEQTGIKYYQELNARRQAVKLIKKKDGEIRKITEAHSVVVEKLREQKARLVDMKKQRDSHGKETEEWKTKHQKEVIEKLKLQKEKLELAKKLDKVR